MSSETNRAQWTLEQFQQHQTAYLATKVPRHPMLTWAPDNRLRLRRKQVFNPAWFPPPQETKPSRKDLVTRGDEQGMVVYISREMEEIGVLFFNQGIEAIDLDCFYSHTSKGGRTRWLLDQ